MCIRDRYWTANLIVLNLYIEIRMCRTCAEILRVTTESYKRRQEFVRQKDFKGQGRVTDKIIDELQKNYYKAVWAIYFYRLSTDNHQVVICASFSSLHGHKAEKKIWAYSANTKKKMKMSADISIPFRKL